MVNYVLGVCVLIGILSKVDSRDKALHPNNTFTKRKYGEDWIFFPDGEGHPHFVDLTIDPTVLRSSNVFDAEFRLYIKTRDNYIIINDTSLPTNDVEIDSSLKTKPIKMITHGWKSSADMDSVINIKDAYLKMSDVNVIAVDWSGTAESTLYPVVAFQTEFIGKVVANFINALRTAYDISGKNLHLIGHSLGAHVMGDAASSSKVTVYRVTGLDPARPLFEMPFKSNSERLDFSDADFVDIIHTCSGLLGYERPVGHVDFYPNNGEAPQPGCLTIENFFGVCSHSRAHLYFAESVLRPWAFLARSCRNWEEYEKNQCSNTTAFMGEAVDTKARGKFYLKTNAEAPYGSSTYISNQFR